MAQPKFTLYKHVKINGQWRYFRAAVASNNKVKPHVILAGGKEEKHEDGSYCVFVSPQYIRNVTWSQQTSLRAWEFAPCV